MLSGENCNAVSELAEGYTYIRGRCKQLGFVNNPQRNDGRYRSGTEYEIITCIDEVDSSIDGFENHSQDICRRVSMSSGDAIKRLTDTNDEPKKDVCDTLSPSEQHTERRLSRDIGTQAISIDFIEEKPKRNHEITKHSTSTWTETNEPEVNLLLSPNSKSEAYYISKDNRRDSYHFHRLISPKNELILARCPGVVPVLESSDSVDTYKSHDGANYVEVPTEDYAKHKCCCYNHHHHHCNHDEHGHRNSTCSSDSSTITPYNIEYKYDLSRRCSNWKSGLVYFMDPCIEDSTENAAGNEYQENEQSKPLIEPNRTLDVAPSTSNQRRNYDKQNSFKRKSIDDSKTRQNITSSVVVPNEEGIELASDAVCPFGLAKNLEKQIQIIPSRKKKSSACPSFLKLVTFILIGSAILITGAAIKEAYY